MKKNITYIVTVYNQEQYISECLDSLLMTNDYSDLIVIDDGSSDNSWELIQAHKSKRDFLAIRQKNSGVSIARNNALLKVKTKYVSFIDGDDCVAPFDSEYINTILEANWDIIQYPILFNWRSNKEIINKNSKIIENENSYIEALLNKELTYSCCNKIFRTSLFKDKSFPVNRRYEDLYLLVSFFYDKPKTLIVPYGLYYYRYNSQSFTFARPSIQKFYDFLVVTDYYISIVKEISNEAYINKLYIYILIELASFKSQLSLKNNINTYHIDRTSLFYDYCKYNQREKLFLIMNFLLGLNLTFSILSLIFKIRNMKQ